jgi:hypothetical protein
LVEKRATDARETLPLRSDDRFSCTRATSRGRAGHSTRLDRKRVLYGKKSPRWKTKRNHTGEPLLRL